MNAKTDIHNAVVELVILCKVCMGKSELLEVHVMDGESVSLTFRCNECKIDFDIPGAKFKKLYLGYIDPKGQYVYPKYYPIGLNEVEKWEYFKNLKHVLHIMEN